MYTRAFEVVKMQLCNNAPMQQDSKLESTRTRLDSASCKIGTYRTGVISTRGYYHFYVKSVRVQFKSLLNKTPKMCGYYSRAGIIQERVLITLVRYIHIAGT